MITSASPRRRLRLWALLACGLLLPSGSPNALADPCGMVPPITPGGQIPIARVGYQQTYVFYKDGLETFVIHPGFTGKVEEFGMLIPFPSVPALRKVPDATFDHLAKAVDPPEVVVYTARQRFFGGIGGGGLGGGGGLEMSAAEPMMAKDAVQVLKEEAVGMYEVAVLQAGSAKALNKWMDERGFVYPEGMDDACNDYIKQKWCFVAVKTRVGTKSGVDPKPGQRNVRVELPENGSFNGHVQAMGFRFKVDELVVPMRLSAFNKGDLHNVVYILTDEPVKIDRMSEKMVVRQIPGKILHANVALPLPVRIIGGTVRDIPKWRRDNLKTERNPEPHNGVAKNLFASDLLSLKENRLTHPHEENEKMLLNIGERLGLRGQAIDRLNEAASEEARSRIVSKSLGMLRNDFTLTVVDGNFERDVIAKQNLTFSPYKMPSALNTPSKYDATLKKARDRQQGRLFYGPISRFEQPQTTDEEQPAVMLPSTTSNLPWDRIGLGTLAVLLMGIVAATLRRRRRLGIAMLSGVTLTLAFAGLSVADDEQPSRPDVSNNGPMTPLDYVEQLRDPKRAEEAAGHLIDIGEKAVPDLIGEASEGDDMPIRGWSIICLSEIGGKDAEAALVRLRDDNAQPPLVRTWAAAGIVQMTDDTDELVKLAAQISQFPAIGRPISKKLVAKLNAEQEIKPETLVAMAAKVPQLQGALAEPITSLGAEPLVTVMRTASDNNIRRLAAGYLGTVAQRSQQDVMKAVVSGYAFDADAEATPWKGGALFIPGIQWQKKEARELVDALIAWMVWAKENKQPAEITPIHNNLRSLNLASAAGYQSPGFRQTPDPVTTWLQVYRTAYGKDALKSLLEAQGLEENKGYAKLLND